MNRFKQGSTWLGLLPAIYYGVTAFFPEATDAIVSVVSALAGFIYNEAPKQN